MKTTAILACLAGLAVTAYAVPAPAPAPAPDLAPAPAPAASYPEGTIVSQYPDGLPASLIPRAMELEKRDDAGVFLCNAQHFTGYCVHIVAPFFQCVNLADDLNDQVSSVGPDSPSYCLFYIEKDCSDGEGHFGTFSPGFSDLAPTGFNERISSYICHPN